MFKKGALALLAKYGSDSSDDDVPGPRVSTKRVHKSEEFSEEPPLKKTQRLHIPNGLLNKTNFDEYIDNCNNHQGRKRSFPHERGNWVTFAFIPCHMSDGMRELISTVINNLPKVFNVQRIEKLHISLTKTVILKHHWIDIFMESIKNRIIYIKKFVIFFGSLHVYCNEERTRTFIGLEIRTGYDSLMKLVEILDECLIEFNLPTFYKDPSFHMSIVWCVGDFENEVKSLLPNLNHMLSELLINFYDNNWYNYVNSIYCKTGNKYYDFLFQ